MPLTLASRAVGSARAVLRSLVRGAFQLGAGCRCCADGPREACVALLFSDCQYNPIDGDELCGQSEPGQLAVCLQTSCVGGAPITPDTVIAHNGRCYRVRPEDRNARYLFVGVPFPDRFGGINGEAPPGIERRNLGEFANPQNLLPGPWRCIGGCGDALCPSFVNVVYGQPCGTVPDHYPRPYICAVELARCSVFILGTPEGPRCYRFDPSEAVSGAAVDFMRDYGVSPDPNTALDDCCSCESTCARCFRYRTLVSCPGEPAAELDFDFAPFAGSLPPGASWTSDQIGVCCSEGRAVHRLELRIDSTIGTQGRGNYTTIVELIECDHNELTNTYTGSVRRIINDYYDGVLTATNDSLTPGCPYGFPACGPFNFYIALGFRSPCGLANVQQRSSCGSRRFRADIVSPPGIVPRETRSFRGISSVVRYRDDGVAPRCVGGCGGGSGPERAPSTLPANNPTLPGPEGLLP